VKVIGSPTIGFCGENVKSAVNAKGAGGAPGDPAAFTSAVSTRPDGIACARRSPRRRAKAARTRLDDITPSPGPLKQTVVTAG
jgi:hypothetical protein